MNPTGPIGPRSIGAFAFVVHLCSGVGFAWPGPAGYAHR
jgi:hypothetical protein